MKLKTIKGNLEQIERQTNLFISRKDIDIKHMSVYGRYPQFCMFLLYEKIRKDQPSVGEDEDTET